MVRALRGLICEQFDHIAWDRVDPSGEPGGGGVRGVLNGTMFEKVGVNVSTVGDAVESELAKSIHGTADNPRFFAPGISRSRTWPTRIFPRCL